MKKLFALLLLLGGSVIASAQTYPKTDALTGTGGMGSNYTCTSSLGATLSKSGGQVTASGSQYAECFWSADTFSFFGTNDQEETVVTPSGGPTTAGPGVMLTASGTGYTWLLNSKQISKVVSGYANGFTDYTCPMPNPGDVAQLSIQGGVLTCKDLTTGASTSFNDSTYMTGSPGVVVYVGSSVAGPLSADCYQASCGNLQTPQPSVPAGTMGKLASISMGVPLNSVDCITVDGSTPTISSHGTCSHGTTYTGGAITLTQKATNTIKVMATSSTYNADSAVGTYVYVLLGVTMSGNAPSMGFPLIANGNATINTVINYGTLNTATVTISGNYGGATATLDKTGSGNTIRTVTAGPVAGTCSIPQVYPVISGNAVGGTITSWNIISPGSNLPANSAIPFQHVYYEFDSSVIATGIMNTNSSGAVVSTSVTNGGSGGFGGTRTTDWRDTDFPNYYKIVSTAGFNLVFTSDDDPTVSVTYPIVVCENHTQVETVPFYETRYTNQPLEIQSMTWGSATQDVTWSITSQPSGGDGQLDPNPLIACETTHTCLNTTFKASVAGRYKVQACNKTETSKCNYTNVYVTGDTQPYNVTANGTEPIDPKADPAGVTAGGHVYEVGPTQTYHTINALDFRTLVPGDTIRLHNEDTTGTNPTKYPEWLAFAVSGTRDAPIRFVGVPDSTGHLPVIEAIDATGPSWINPYINSGVVNYWGPGCSGPYADGPAGSCGPNFQIFEGVRIQNANKSNNRHSYDLTSAPVYVAWPNDPSAIADHSGYGHVFRGIDSYSNTQLAGVYTPNGKGWAAITQMIDIEGNNCRLYGNASDPTEHCIYDQAFATVVGYNNITNPVSGDQGNVVKMRSGLYVVKGNFFGTGAARILDLVEVQDAAQEFGIDEYYCHYGDCSGFLYPYPVGQNWSAAYVGGGITPAISAALNQAGRNQWVVGNIFQGDGTVNAVHYAADHYSPDLVQKGTLHFLSNTVIHNHFFLDQNNNGGNGWHEYSTLDAQNNIIDGDSANALTTMTAILANFGKNLFRTGLVSTGPGITPCHTNGGDTCGWGDGITLTSDWTNQVPLDGHMTGVNTTNFLYSSVLPVNTTTFKPISGSAAIHAGAPATGLAANFAVKMQFNPDLGYATIRQDPLTLGARDLGPPPSLSTITIVPTPVGLITNSSLVLAATCNYSDSTSHDCTSSVTWSNQGASYFTVNSMGTITAGSSAGSGTAVMATLGAVSGTASVTVTLRASLYGGHFTLKGKFK